MRIALVADTFPPLRSSGAVQLRDLSRELVRQGHDVTVLLPAAGLAHPYLMEALDGVRVLRLKAPSTKDIGYVRRTLAEFAMPFWMLRNFRKSPLACEKWGGVVWYSPSIFLGPLAHALKRKSRCPGYLIVRDIFPEWALDLGLMRRGLPYLFFKWTAAYQYSVADIIGIQTAGNGIYFRSWVRGKSRALQVLPNWIDDAPNTGCSISIERTVLAGRKIFVYAGNMGVAQGMDLLLDFAKAMLHRSDVGFLFVGRGQHATRLAELARSRGLTNAVFHDEIPPEEIPGLFEQCHIGLVALDPRHKSHNIPGKFLTYMQSGLPVFAHVNKGNDLISLIQSERVGHACSDACGPEMARAAERLLHELDSAMQQRCRELYVTLYSPASAAKQIVDSLQAPRPKRKTRQGLRRLSL
jgi:glycosyltransferase involved in cell wall biosynthesis